MDLVLTCPCQKTLRCENFLGTVIYVHEEDGEGCDWYNAVALSVERMLLQEATLPDGTAHQRAVFLASKQVRLCVYKLMSEVKGEQLITLLRLVHQAVEGIEQEIRERILREMLTVFGTTLRNNWEIVFSERLHALQALPGLFPTYKLSPLRGEATTLIDYRRERRRV